MKLTAQGVPDLNQLGPRRPKERCPQGGPHIMEPFIECDDDEAGQVRKGRRCSRCGLESNVQPLPPDSLEAHLFRQGQLHWYT